MHTHTHAPLPTHLYAKAPMYTCANKHTHSLQGFSMHAALGVPHTDTNWTGVYWIVLFACVLLLAGALAFRSLARSPETARLFNRRDMASARRDSERDDQSTIVDADFLSDQHLKNMPLFLQSLSTSAYHQPSVQEIAAAVDESRKARKWSIRSKMDVIDPTFYKVVKLLWRQSVVVLCITIGNFVVEGQYIRVNGDKHATDFLFYEYYIGTAFGIMLTLASMQIPENWVLGLSITRILIMIPVIFFVATREEKLTGMLLVLNVPFAISGGYCYTIAYTHGTEKMRKNDLDPTHGTGVLGFFYFVGLTVGIVAAIVINSSCHC
eukprot:m.86896 g.86896  ORF g.86896 m.86896 type:complete len:323 (+) comp16380_c1_seq3:95-1063(+)